MVLVQAETPQCSHRIKGRLIDLYCRRLHTAPGSPIFAVLLCLGYGTLTFLAVSSYVRHHQPSAKSNDVIRTVYAYPDHYHVVAEPDISMATNDTLLVFVQSAPSNVQKRAIIRSTWANRTYYAKFGDQINVIVLFALGKDYIGKSDNWEAVQREIAEYKDVLLLDMRDEYNMLSLKGLYTMKWIAGRLPQVRYVMKTDDDVLLNVPAWMEVVHSLRRRKASCCIVCYVWIHPEIMRWHSKYSVSVQEYPHGNYPSFCGGLGYLLTREALVGILHAAEYLPLFVRDDPYFTGMLGHMAQVKLITVPRETIIIGGSPEEVAGALQEPILTVHDPPLPVWSLLWEQMSIDFESGVRRRRVSLRTLLPEERILPYIANVFDVKQNSSLFDKCSLSEPDPGSTIDVYL